MKTKKTLYVKDMLMLTKSQFFKKMGEKDQSKQKMGTKKQNKTNKKPKQISEKNYSDSKCIERKHNFSHSRRNSNEDYIYMSCMSDWRTSKSLATHSVDEALIHCWWKCKMVHSLWRKMLFREKGICIYFLTPKVALLEFTMKIN